MAKLADRIAGSCLESLAHDRIAVIKFITLACSDISEDDRPNLLPAQDYALLINKLQNKYSTRFLTCPKCKDCHMELINGCVIPYVSLSLVESSLPNVISNFLDSIYVQGQKVSVVLQTFIKFLHNYSPESVSFFEDFVDGVTKIFCDYRTNFPPAIVSHPCAFPRVYHPAATKPASSPTLTSSLLSASSASTPPECCATLPSPVQLSSVGSLKSIVLSSSTSHSVDGDVSPKQATATSLIVDSCSTPEGSPPIFKSSSRTVTFPAESSTFVTEDYSNGVNKIFCDYGVKFPQSTISHPCAHPQVFHPSTAMVLSKISSLPPTTTSSASDVASSSIPSISPSLLRLADAAHSMVSLRMLEEGPLAVGEGSPLVNKNVEELARDTSCINEDTPPVGVGSFSSVDLLPPGTPRTVVADPSLELELNRGLTDLLGEWRPAKKFKITYP